MNHFGSFWRALAILLDGVETWIGVPFLNAQSPIAKSFQWHPILCTFSEQVAHLQVLKAKVYCPIWKVE